MEPRVRELKKSSKAELERMLRYIEENPDAFGTSKAFYLDMWAAVKEAIAAK